MSTFDDASLVLIPSGYKASKVYSVKPTDGTGDLTFTRSLDTATRVGPDGLIEKVRTNLVLQSQTFDNAGWTKEGCAVTANTTIAPDGTLTGDSIVENAAASTQHRLLQGSTIANNTEHTTSVFVKRVTGTRDFAIINITSGARVYFNLTTGAVGDEVLGKGSIQDVGNGWFRCTATGVSTGTSLNIFLALTNAATTGSETYSGDGVSSLAFWGAQLETGVATTYIPTTTAAVSVGMLANVPRLDYTGGGCPKLLLEPQRQNVITFSEQFNNAAWTKQNATIAANVATSPAGFLDADKLQEDATTSIHAFGNVTASATSGQVVTFSVFLKKAERNFAALRLFSGAASLFAWFNLDTGVIGQVTAGATAAIDEYNNDWYRCSITITMAASSVSLPFVCASNADGVTSYAGTAGHGIFAYGCQVEAGSFATSYIPTLGAAVTRSADAASKTGISALIGQTEGTLYWEGEISAVSELRRLIFVSDGTTNNFVHIAIDAANKIIGAVRVGGSAISNFESTAITGGNFNIAFAYKANDCALFINAVSVGGSSGATLPSTSRLDIGSRLGNDSFLNSGTSQALLFKTRLTNDQLAELTA